jgi:hypothetical protein
VKRTHASACGIGQAVKQNDGYAAAKKMGGEEAGDVSRISGGCLHGSSGSRR